MNSSPYTPEKAKRGRVAVIFCPLWPTRLTERRLKTGKIIINEETGEREKFCAGCDEYWPADTTAYQSNRSHKDGLSKWCIACCSEWRAGRRALGFNY